MPKFLRSALRSLWDLTLTAGPVALIAIAILAAAYWWLDPTPPRTLRLATLDDAAHAIRVMQVRGAPLIGVTAAYGVAFALAAHPDDAALQQALGGNAIEQVAAKFGLNGQQAGDLLAQYLPNLVDSATPEGKVQDADGFGLDDLASLVLKNLVK